MTDTRKSELKESLLDNQEQDSQSLEPLLAHSQQKKNSYQHANLFSKLSFHWVTPLMMVKKKFNYTKKRSNSLFIYIILN